MDNGFIKLHRKLIEWEWFTDSNTFHVFMFLLLDANHADKKWKGVMVKRGEKTTSVDKIRLRTGLSTQTVRTCLKRLESTREITIKTTNRYSIITICNYDTYQSKENSTNKQLTNDQQTANKQLTTNKNEKKDKHEEASLMMKDKIIRLLPGVETVYEFELEKWKTKRETSKPVMDLNLNLMDWMRRASEKIPKDTKTEERESNRKKMEAYTGPPL